MNMTERTDFATEYRGMTDEQLLEIAGEGNLVDEAQQALRVEMQNRKLTPDMVQSYHAETKRYELARNAEIEHEPFSFSPFRLYGRAYLSDEDRAQGIQVRTKWLTMRGLPIIPVASYRYCCQDLTTGLRQRKEEKVVDQVPLNWGQVLRTAAVTYGLILLSLALIVVVGEWQAKMHSR